MLISWSASEYVDDYKIYRDEIHKAFVKLGENKHGEQILCVRNKETGQFHFHHGDCGWEAIYYIDNPPLLSDDEVEFILNAYGELEFAQHNTKEDHGLQI